jgi:hypothetical protein
MTNVRSVAEFTSLREGFETSPCRPFVVRHAGEFLRTSYEVALERFRTSREHVFGYDDTGGYIEGLVLSTLVEQWLGDRLGVKVLDSPMHLVDLPAVLDEFAAPMAHAAPPEDGSFAGRVLRLKHGQSPVLTRADTYTPFHVDPPYFGGGWMYLWRGSKTWHFLSQEWISTLFQESTGKIRDASIGDLLSLDPGIACFTTTAGGGDFVYFPPGWIHRVWTHEKSIGIGGYMLLEGATAESLQAVERLHALGKDFAW